MTFSRRWLQFPALLGLTLASTACDGSHSTGGFTNPSAESIVDPNKGGTRSDLPVPSGNPKQSSGLGDASTDYAKEVGNDKAASTPPAATPAAEPTGSPPAKTDMGSAAGATKPAGDIKAGTPKSPQ